MTGIAKRENAGAARAQEGGGTPARDDVAPAGGAAAGAIARFVCRTRAQEMPGDTRKAAELHLLDALGCGLAAHALGVGTEARTVAAQEGGRAEATVIGLGERLPASAAAFANASLCHALDFDDTHVRAILHPYTVIGPAALAVAEARGATGAELVTALVLGGEVAIRLGEAAAGAFHARGFHPTATCGIFGAIAAVARLEGLDESGVVDALGVAGSQASGLLAFLADGTETKSLNAGWAARGAVTAVRLAAAGAQGPPSILDGRFGVWDAFLGQAPEALHDQLADLGSRWETPEIAIKPYAACHFIHGCITAARELLKPLNGDAIEAVIARIPATGVPIVAEPVAAKLAPRTAYEGKFSLQYTVASMLARHEVTLATYTDEALAEAEVLELAARVTYEVDDTLDSGAFPGALEVRTRSGRTLHAVCALAPGTPGRPLTADEIERKFRENAALTLAAPVVAALQAGVLGLDDAPDVSAVLSRSAV